MTTALLCFASTFVSVFALGLQSLNVNQGHYWAAGFTSLLIGAGHIALYKFMPGATLTDVAGYLAGGVAGITSSMWFHRTVKAWWRRRTEETAQLDQQVRALEWQADRMLRTIRGAGHSPPAPTTRKPLPPPRHPNRTSDEHAAQHFPPCLECGRAAGESCGRLVCERWAGEEVVH